MDTVRRLDLGVVTLMMVTGTAAAPGTAGTSERAALMNAIRPSGVKIWGAPIVFVVQTIRIDGGYAFVSVRPKRRTGAGIKMMLAGGRGDAYGEALLHKAGLSWRILEFRAAPSDVWQCTAKYRRVVPASVLGSC